MEASILGKAWSIAHVGLKKGFDKISKTDLIRASGARVHEEHILV
jgi:hypothetical protein